jgi:hypothetical protein
MKTFEEWWSGYIPIGASQEVAAFEAWDACAADRDARIAELEKELNDYRLAAGAEAKEADRLREKLAVAVEELREISYSRHEEVCEIMKGRRPCRCHVYSATEALEKIGDVLQKNAREYQEKYSMEEK